MKKFVQFVTKNKSVGNSLVFKWLGLSTLTAVAQVQNRSIFQENALLLLERESQIPILYQLTSILKLIHLITFVPILASPDHTEKSLIETPFTSPQNFYSFLCSFYLLLDAFPFRSNQHFFSLSKIHFYFLYLFIYF